MPGLVFGVAKLLKVAAIALRFASDAHLATMMDELVGEGDPAAMGNDLHQLQFDFLRGVAFGKAEAM